MEKQMYQLEQNVTSISDELDKELYLRTVIIPTSKLIFTQPFLMKYRIKEHMKRIKKQHSKRNVYESKDQFGNVCVVRENGHYVILGGNCTSYAVIKLGFKRVKVRVFKPEALDIWVGRRSYKGKQIRKTRNEIVVLKNSYDYHENTHKLLWFTIELQLHLIRHGLNNNQWYHEGKIININENEFLLPENYIIHENRENDEPLVLVKREENTYLIVDGIERLNSYKQANKNKIEAWIFTILPKRPTLETWLERIPHEFNKVWNEATK